MKIGLACRYTYANEEHRAINHADTLLSILVPQRPGGSTEGVGSGAYNDPFRPTTIGQWYGLS
jgi:hypothetical protein